MPPARVFRRAGLTSLAAAASLLLTPALAHAWEIPAEEIAERAESIPDGYGDQCKVFAQRVVNEVLADHGIRARVGGYGTPGGAYFGAYERAGGLLIVPESGQRGDLIQVIRPEHRNKDFPPTRDRDNESILHTAIILETVRPGVYKVRDSNYVAWETIGTHRWRPLEWRERGVEVYVWRFGRAPDPVVVPSAHVAVGATPPARSLRA